MRKILLIILLFPFCVQAQTVIQQNPVNNNPASPGYNKQGFQWSYGWFLNTFGIPFGSAATLNNANDREGLLYFRTSDSTLLVRHNHTWQVAGGGGGTQTLYVDGKTLVGRGVIDTPLKVNVDTIKHGQVLVLDANGRTGHDTSQYLPNTVISGLTVTATEPNASITAGTWRIHDLLYSTSTTTTLGIDAQDPTQTRYDAAVGNPNNTLSIISGTLSADSATAVQPTIPLNKVLVGYILITPTVVQPIPNPPITGFVDLTSWQVARGHKTWYDYASFNNQALFYSRDITKPAISINAPSGNALQVNGVAQFNNVATGTAGDSVFVSHVGNLRKLPFTNFGNIYNTDGTVTGPRTVTIPANHDITFDFGSGNSFLISNLLGLQYNKSTTDISGANYSNLFQIGVVNNHGFNIETDYDPTGDFSFDRFGVQSVDNGITLYHTTPSFTQETAGFTVTGGFQITSDKHAYYSTVNHTGYVSGTLTDKAYVDSVASVHSVTSVTSANGNATVANPTTTPVITIVSAPKLQTARTIQGVSFDGTANINPINGTGFVKASGTTLSYDNTSYQPVITLTTAGTSGAATFISNTLNIPNYGSAVPSAANPSGLLTFTPTNGVATTFLRSDGLHAIDSTVVASRALLSTYQTKAQNVAAYQPLEDQRLSTTNTVSFSGLTSANMINAPGVRRSADNAILNIQQRNYTLSTGVQVVYQLIPTIAQTGSAGYTADLTNVTESTTGSGAKLLKDWQVGSVSVASVTNTGVIRSAALTASSPVFTDASKNLVSSTLLVPAFISSAAGTLTLTAGVDYGFTGTSTTWTLPAPSGTATGRAYQITIKNAGTLNITVNSASGSQIYDTTLVASITVTPGSAVTLMPSGSVWYKE